MNTWISLVTGPGCFTQFHVSVTCQVVMTFDARFHFYTSTEATGSVLNNTAR